jgi:hypothetical protein
MQLQFMASCCLQIPLCAWQNIFQRRPLQRKGPHSAIKKEDVRFEVSTAVTMMIIIFWEMTPCGSYKNRRFEGSYEDGGDTILRRFL